VVLQGISRGHEQPKAVERKAPQGHQRHVPMTLMGWIEAAAVKAYSLARAMRWEARDHRTPARPTRLALKSRSLRLGEARSALFKHEATKSAGGAGLLTP
jgi:hypothetical protein